MPTDIWQLHIRFLSIIIVEIFVVLGHLVAYLMSSILQDLLIIRTYFLVRNKTSSIFAMYRWLITRDHDKDPASGMHQCIWRCYERVPTLPVLDLIPLTHSYVLSKTISPFCSNTVDSHQRCVLTRVPLAMLPLFFGVVEYTSLLTCHATRKEGLPAKAEGLGGKEERQNWTEV